MTRTVLRNILVISILFSLVACGGGGSGAVSRPIFPTSPLPPPPASNGWQSGVFAAQSTFQNRCAVPRTGTDPTNDNKPYPDLAGTTTDENNFLRSFTNRTYLWYKEITDRDPGTFNRPTDYFDQLKTFAKTSSGSDKDQFSFYLDSQEWYDLSQSGVSVGYGANFALITRAPPRKIVVAYTEPKSPATNAATLLLRGTEILKVDGANVSDGNAATLNAGLFPDKTGETHTFEVKDAGEFSSSRMVTLTSAAITDAMVQNTKVIETLSKQRVGYMTFNYHRAPAEKALVDAINKLKEGVGINDLVLDIRYNGGGYGAIANQLAYMIAGAAKTAGKNFNSLQFNDKHPATDPISGRALAPDPFYKTTLGFSLTQGRSLPALDLPRVFILTGRGTCSASELIINGLRGAGVRVIQIGSTTCGKPYGFHEEPNCGTSYFPIQFRILNDKNFGGYTDGFVPSAVDNNMANVLGCSVADDYSKPLGDPEENRLEVALAYQAGTVCKTPVSVGGSNALSKPGLSLDSADGIIPRSPFDSNIVMRRP